MQQRCATPFFNNGSSFNWCGISAINSITPLLLDGRNWIHLVNSVKSGFNSFWFNAFAGCFWLLCDLAVLLREVVWLSRQQSPLQSLALIGEGWQLGSESN